MSGNSIPGLDVNSDMVLPGLSPGTDSSIAGMIDKNEWLYRIGYFSIASGDSDDTVALERLLTRSLQGEIVLMDRKDSISATTGAYTTIVIYLEKRTNA